MSEEKKFDPNQNYSLLFYSTSLQIFREGIGMYTDYLKKWQDPENKGLTDELNRNEGIAEYLEDYINKAQGDWDLVMIPMWGELLIRLKSTLPYLLKKLQEEKNNLKKENAPALAFEKINKRIKEIEELMVVGMMKEIPARKDMMGALEEERDIKEDETKKHYGTEGKGKAKEIIINIVDKMHAGQGDIIAQTGNKNVLDKSTSSNKKEAIFKGIIIAVISGLILLAIGYLVKIIF